MKLDGVLTTTRMAGPADLMDQERAYLAALAKTARYQIDGTKLVLWGDDPTGRVATYELAKP
jgi:heat shock protein HslJ